MFQKRHHLPAFAFALVSAMTWGAFTAHADHRRDDRDDGHDERGRKVFVIAMENHNWTQPATDAEPAADLHEPAGAVHQQPRQRHIRHQRSGRIRDATTSTPAIGVHPSEPNYIWAEAGTNFGVLNDDDPYHADCSPDTVQTTDQHLSAFLTKARRTWGRIRRTPTWTYHQHRRCRRAAWTVPLFNLSGVFTDGGLNGYNYSTQYNYAAKHNPMVFFTDTDGGCDTTTSNPMRTHYAPLQQLALDLQRRRRRRLQLDYPEPVQRQHTGLTQRLRRLTRHTEQRRPRGYRAGRQFPGPHRPVDHGVGGVPGSWRDRAVVGRERRRRQPLISRCRSSSSRRTRART